MRLGLTGSVVIFLACAEAAVAQPLPAQFPGNAPPLYFELPTSPMGPTAVPMLPPVTDASPFAGLPVDGPPAGFVEPRYGTTHEANAYPYVTWARAELLLWWVKDGPAPPPLVTTGPPNIATAGVLGQPGTSILFGDQPLDFGTSGGGRWTVGMWCDVHQNYGVELSGFVLERRAEIFNARSDGTGTPVIARPFIDAQAGIERSEFPAFPGSLAGGISVAANDRLYGFEVNFLDNCWHGGTPLADHQLPYGEWRVEWQAGFRFMELREELNVGQVSTVLVASSPPAATFLNVGLLPPDVVATSDSFDTRNQFYGGQLGTHAEWVHGSLFVDVLGKVAVGVTHEVVAVTGTSQLAPFSGVGTGTSLVAPGGLLATATNIGASGRTRFGFVPELGLTVGYQCGPYCRFFTGYTFLYWNDVVRPGNQIDRTVNLTQVPIAVYGPLSGPAQPVRLFNQSDFWAQGISLGFEVRF
jgi:hypothetical protein